MEDITIDPIDVVTVVDSAIETFETEMPEYRGMLNAHHLGSNWIWNGSTKRYHNQKTKTTVTSNTILQLRNDFITEHLGKLSWLAEDLVCNELSLGKWVSSMRNIIADAHTAQYLMAIGGRYVISPHDLEVLKGIINSQYQDLQNWIRHINISKAKDINIFSANIDAGVITIRSLDYIEATAGTHERGKASSYNIELPAYPIKCRCRWEINETENYIDAFWMHDIGSIHPPECLSYAAKWAPYKIPKF